MRLLPRPRTGFQERSWPRRARDHLRIRTATAHLQPQRAVSLRERGTPAAREPRTGRRTGGGASIPPDSRVNFRSQPDNHPGYGESWCVGRPISLISAHSTLADLLPRCRHAATPRPFDMLSVARAAGDGRHAPAPPPGDHRGSDACSLRPPACSLAVCCPIVPGDAHGGLLCRGLPSRAADDGPAALTRRAISGPRSL